MKKDILKRCQQMMLKNKKLALVWIESEFGTYENYLNELNKIDPVEKALKNKKIAKKVLDNLNNLM